MGLADPFLGMRVRINSAESQQSGKQQPSKDSTEVHNKEEARKIKLLREYRTRKNRLDTNSPIGVEK